MSYHCHFIIQTAVKEFLHAVAFVYLPSVSKGSEQLVFSACSPAAGLCISARSSHGHLHRHPALCSE